MDNPAIQSFISHSSSAVTFYSRNMEYSGSRCVCESSLNNLEDNKHGGVMSHNSMKRLKKSIHNFTLFVTASAIRRRQSEHAAKNNSCMITLTLPSHQEHSDQFIRANCLDQFLTELRLISRDFRYVCVSEKQGNGNIHFHIICNRYLPWRIARNIWNRILEKYGYITRFEIKHGHRDPNSTDVHGLREVKNVSRYLLKYMTKDNMRHVAKKKISTADNVPLNAVSSDDIDDYLREHGDNLKISGKIWSCSQGLSAFKSIICDYEYTQKKIYQSLESGDIAREYVTEYATTYYFNSALQAFQFYEKNLPNVLQMMLEVL